MSRDLCGKYVFISDIDKDTKANNFYRSVRYTNEHIQIVFMSLLPLQEIGMEKHCDNTQFFRVESGNGKIIIEGAEFPLYDGSAYAVPSGVYHNVINTSSTEPLKLYTIYSPPHHPANTQQPIKID